MAHFSKKQIIIVGVVFVLIVAVFFLFTANRQNPQTGPAISLSVWGVDSPEVFGSLIAGYRAYRPNVTITYTAIEPARFRGALLDALAAGRGPDVFVIRSGELLKYQSIISPAPQTQVSFAQVHDLFPAATGQDFTDGKSVYALPLSLDSVALIYNRDLFDQATIPTPPKTWDEFVKLIPELRVLNDKGQLDRAAAALGGSSRSMSRVTDIVSLLMFQNGAPMTALGGGSADFFGAKNEGLKAFSFYLDFSDLNSGSYTWNDAEGNAFDRFASGDVAMVFGTYEDTAVIKKKNPFVNFAIAGVPQATGGTPTAMPAETGLTVSLQSKNPMWGWDFITFAATNEQALGSYLSAANRPPALRTLIAKNIDDSTLGVFAKQALMARTWNVPDAEASEAIFSDAVLAVHASGQDPARALKEAQGKVNALYRK